MKVTEFAKNFNFYQTSRLLNNRKTVQNELFEKKKTDRL